MTLAAIVAVLLTDTAVNGKASVRLIDTEADCKRDVLALGADTVRIKNSPIDLGVLASLFPKYSSAEYGRKPVVKSQGKYGTCWALAASSALEASLLPEMPVVLSADHMALNNAFTTELSDGGTYAMAMAYLSSWQGPVEEAQDPYGDAYSPEGLEPVFHVQEMQLLEEASLAEIKRAVCAYGAVQTSLCMDRSMASKDTMYYAERTASFYNPNEAEATHDVIILGWDDDYSRFRFKQIPERNGAFICQNSWGDDFGEDGIFYVSYEDANIAKQALVYSRIEATDQYDRIYQYDDCGWQGKQGYGQEACWMANVYTAEEESLLAAAGFYATGRDTSYELYLVHDFLSEESFAQMEYLQSGRMSYGGYYTVDLETAVPLAAGERFAVVAKITTPGETAPAAVEYRADQYTQQVTTEGKESYLSQSAEFWENTQQRFGTNVCLKAYTVKDTQRK